MDTLRTHPHDSSPGPSESPVDGEPAEPCPQEIDGPHEVPEPAASWGWPALVVAAHRHREEIETLLCAGWSARMVNQHLGRVYPDYVPVPERTLQWHRKTQLQGRLRPTEEWERQLQEEHMLLDSFRTRAALIVVQKARLQKVLDQEEQRAGVSPGAGREIDRLARLLDAYDAAADKYGIGRGAARNEMTLEQYLHQEIETLPTEVRYELAAVLEHQGRAAPH
jgi:hypothetical protein